MPELTGEHSITDEGLMNSLKTAFVFGGAGIAQLVEQLICNQQVVGSNPTAGSLEIVSLRELENFAWTLFAFTGPKKIARPGFTPDEPRPENKAVVVIW
jgi:hypothetical protein